MLKHLKSLIFFCGLSPLVLFAQSITGKIYDEEGKPLPFANIYIENTTYGTVSNNLGNYYLLLKKPGKYTVVFSFMGYESRKNTFDIHENQNIHYDIQLKPLAATLKEVVIKGENRNRGAEIVSYAREKRKFYENKLPGFSASMYLKNTIEKEPVNLPDSLTANYMDTVSLKDLKNLSDLYKRQKTNLIESVSEIIFKKPDRVNEKVVAFHDFIEKKPFFNKNISLTFSLGREDIVPEPTRPENPFLYFRTFNEVYFDFYSNTTLKPFLTQRPILSPIAAGAELHYRYFLEKSFYQNGQLIYKIYVKPVFPNEALWNGYIYIEDQSWALVRLDLTLNKNALLNCINFHLIQDYQNLGDSVYVPQNLEINYTFKEGKTWVLVNTRAQFNNIQVMDSSFPELKKGLEVIYEENAENKDSAFWQTARPIPLKENEMQFIQRVDSISEYFASDEYFRKLDSAFNRVTYWVWLTGYGHRNRKAGYEFFVDGLLSQINPVGIGGYRHRLPGYFNYTFKNNFLLENRFFIDYGFRNHDIKGKLGAGLTYYPQKFVRTFIEAGYFYEMINNYESLERIFSRSNYVKTTSFRISQRMEIVNGLFAELSLDYSDKQPLTDLQLSRWSEYIFGELNQPRDFERYTKTEIDLELKYRFHQKYILKDGKKIIIGDDYPEIHLLYRQGIPGLFDSQVDFGYLQMDFYKETRAGIMGTSRFKISTGKFFNTHHIRPLEYRFFRSSDRYFFSDPLYSFQLFDYDSIIYTYRSYLSAGYIHHFEGKLLGSLPVINKLKPELALGSTIFYLPENQGHNTHLEFFAGIERVITIKKQPFRLGIYAVGNEFLFQAKGLTFKAGIDFYNTYSNKWNY